MAITVGAAVIPRVARKSLRSISTISCSLHEATAGSAAPPAKAVNKTEPAGARPENSEELQTQPSRRTSSFRGTRKPKPSSEWETSDCLYVTYMTQSDGYSIVRSSRASDSDKGVTRSALWYAGTESTTASPARLRLSPSVFR